MISPAYNAGVLEGSPHPNAGHLFSAFPSDAAGSGNIAKIRRGSFVPGTAAYKYAQGKKVIYMKQEHAEMRFQVRLTSEYAEVFGFQK